MAPPPLAFHPFHPPFTARQATYGEEDLSMSPEELQQFAGEIADGLRTWEADMRK